MSTFATVALTVLGTVVFAVGIASVLALANVRGHAKRRIHCVERRAEEVLGDFDKATDWLSSENNALGGVTPISLLDTDAGAQSVMDLLGRIEHGVYS